MVVVAVDCKHAARATECSSTKWDRNAVDAKIRCLRCGQGFKNSVRASKHALKTKHFLLVHADTAGGSSSRLLLLQPIQPPPSTSTVVPVAEVATSRTEKTAATVPPEAQPVVSETAALCAVVVECAKCKTGPVTSLIPTTTLEYLEELSGVRNIASRDAQDCWTVVGNQGQSPHAPETHEQQQQRPDERQDISMIPPHPTPPVLVPRRLPSRGLSNPTNLCFLNVVLQSLAQIPEIRERLRAAVQVGIVTENHTQSLHATEPSIALMRAVSHVLDFLQAPNIPDFEDEVARKQHQQHSLRHGHGKGGSGSSKRKKAAKARAKRSGYGSMASGWKQLRDRVSSQTVLSCLASLAPQFEGDFQQDAFEALSVILDVFEACPYDSVLLNRNTSDSQLADGTGLHEEQKQQQQRDLDNLKLGMFGGASETTAVPAAAAPAAAVTAAIAIKPSASVTPTTDIGTLPQPSSPPHSIHQGPIHDLTSFEIRVLSRCRACDIITLLNTETTTSITVPLSPPGPLPSLSVPRTTRQNNNSSITSETETDAEEANSACSHRAESELARKAKVKGESNDRETGIGDTTDIAVSEVLGEMIRGIELMQSDCSNQTVSSKPGATGSSSSSSSSSTCTLPAISCLHAYSANRLVGGPTEPLEAHVKSKPSVAGSGAASTQTQEGKGNKPGSCAFCGECAGKVVRSLIVSLPHVLVVHFNRFGVVRSRYGGGVQLRKLDATINLPTTICGSSDLDLLRRKPASALSPPFSNDGAGVYDVNAMSSQDSQAIYGSGSRDNIVVSTTLDQHATLRLRSVVVHKGSLSRGGHYSVYLPDLTIYSQQHDHQQQRWYAYSDDEVRSISTAEALNNQVYVAVYSRD